MKASETVSATAERAESAGVLADPGWLAAHLGDPHVRVVEVDVSRAPFDEWHIDGAVLWNIYRDLKDDDYHLLDIAALEELLTRSGIGPDSTVVFYGYAPALGFWLMDLYGHRDVRILNCSRGAWRNAGHPWSSSVTAPAVSRYDLGVEARPVRADRLAVLAAMGSGATLVDVRSEAEYRGERFWPSGGLEPNGRAGHIPGAVLQPIDGLYREDGSFRSEEELRTVFSAIDFDGTDDLITYCTIGGRAATAWFVLTRLLDHDRVRVYDGSWADWGRTPDAPVER